MKNCGFVMTAAALILVPVLASSPLAAQGRSNGHGVRVLPPTPRTPYGLCRIWINGVAPVRQPAATGCAYAYSNVPRNGRVIYGGERGELFGRPGPYYYDARNRDYRDRGYRDSYRDSYRYDSRYRRDDEDRDRGDWSYRTDDRYGNSEYSWHHDRANNGRGGKGHGRWK